MSHAVTLVAASGGSVRDYTLRWAVDAGNQRGRHLHESLGFREERIESDGAAVMVADF